MSSISTYILNTFAESLLKVNPNYNSRHINEVMEQAVCLAFLRGLFTCIGWRMKLCDPIWQVMLYSSVMGFSIFYYLFPFTCLFHLHLCSICSDIIKSYSSSSDTLCIVTEHHLPYGITWGRWICLPNPR